MNHSGDGEFLARKVGGPEILVYDENRLPIWVKVSETASIVFATTGIAGGGKDTAAMSRRRVTGRCFDHRDVNIIRLEDCGNC